MKPKCTEQVWFLDCQLHCMLPEDHLDDPNFQNHEYREITPQKDFIVLTWVEVN